MNGNVCDVSFLGNLRSTRLISETRGLIFSVYGEWRLCLFRAPLTMLDL